MTNEERIKSYRDIAKDYYSKILQVIEAKKEVQTKEKLNDMKSTSSLYSGIIFIGGTALGTIIGAATFAPFLASLGVSLAVWGVTAGITKYVASRKEKKFEQETIKMSQTNEKKLWEDYRTALSKSNALEKYSSTKKDLMPYEDLFADYDGKLYFDENGSLDEGKIKKDKEKERVRKAWEEGKLDIIDVSRKDNNTPPATKITITGDAFTEDDYEKLEDIEGTKRRK